MKPLWEVLEFSFGGVSPLDTGERGRNCSWGGFPLSNHHLEANYQDVY